MSLFVCPQLQSRCNMIMKIYYWNINIIVSMYGEVFDTYYFSHSPWRSQLILLLGPWSQQIDTCKKNQSKHAHTLISNCLIIVLTLAPSTIKIFSTATGTRTLAMNTAGRMAYKNSALIQTMGTKSADSSTQCLRYTAPKQEIWGFQEWSTIGTYTGFMVNHWSG